MKNKKVIQNDGAYMNAVTGLGTNISKSNYNQIDVGGRGFLDTKELSSMYEKDGIAAKIVSCIVEDSLACGFEIVGDKNGEIQSGLNKIGFDKAIYLAGVYSRLYGGAVIVLRIADGRLLSEEPAEKGEIIAFDVFSSAKVNFDSGDFENDENSPEYGKLKSIKINNGDKLVEVSTKRCIFINGTIVPDGDVSVDVKTKFFGMSCLNALSGKLISLGISLNAIDDAMQEFKVCGYKLSDLALMLSRPNGGEKELQNRFAAINLGKSMCRAVILDKDDEYFSQESNFGGISEIVLKLMQMVSSAADIPMARLFGESASGLSSTGEGDRAMYDQKVNSWRINTLYSPICKIISNYTARNKTAFKCEDIAFNPVSEPKQSEFVNMCKIQAETMKIYFDMGVLSPEEIRKMVFEGGHSFNMNVL